MIPLIPIYIPLVADLLKQVKIHGIVSSTKTKTTVFGR